MRAAGRSSSGISSARPTAAARAARAATSASRASSLDKQRSTSAGPTTSHSPASPIRRSTRCCRAWEFALPLSAPRHEAPAAQRRGRVHLGDDTAAVERRVRTGSRDNRAADRAWPAKLCGQWRPTAVGTSPGSSIPTYRSSGSGTRTCPRGRRRWATNRRARVLSDGASKGGGPAQRNIYTELVHSAYQLRDRGVIDAAGQVGDGGASIGPVDHARSCTCRLRGQVDAGGDHRAEDTAQLFPHPSRPGPAAGDRPRTGPGSGLPGGGLGEARSRPHQWLEGMAGVRRPDATHIAAAHHIRTEGHTSTETHHGPAHTDAERGPSPLGSPSPACQS